MGQPRAYLLRDWENLPALQVPDPADPDRFAGVPEFIAANADRYRMASLGLTGFTLMFCLRGRDQLMLDLAQAPERIEGLADIVLDSRRR
jgi:hypothetical protein